jgi:uncharacterized protein YdaU (DUF1376 family)
MSKQGPYIPFYPSDWLAGVADMTPAECGVYINLLAQIYDTGGPIKADFARLARRMNCPKATLTALVSGLTLVKKLTIKDGMISNERAEKEIEKRGHKAAAASESARARWGKSEAKTIAVMMRTHSECNANQISEPDIDTKVSIPKPQKPKQRPPDKNDDHPFWKARAIQSQTGRDRFVCDRAWPKWSDAVQEFGEDALLSGFRRYLASHDASKDGGKFQMGLQVWLNGPHRNWIQVKSENQNDVAKTARLFLNEMQVSGISWRADWTEKTGLTENQARELAA